MSEETPRDPPDRPPDARTRRLLLAAALVGTLVIVYLPALSGGFLWDDDFWVRDNPHLTAPDGLRRIWLTTESVQYYPMVFTTFRIERALYGLSTTGYHVDNLLLHAASALALGLLLARLGIPGAWLAAALFALHPVAVESVAWITERKNVLSALFYLLAALAWLRYDERRRPGWWLAAFGLFLAALLSKTVTCTLPVALLLLAWWRRGTIERRIVAPLVPFFLAGAALGGWTAWYEVAHVGAKGGEWSLSFAERLLVAGRAPLFYLGKLAWPAGLVFIYPRWQLDPASVTAWLRPLATLSIVAALWFLRHRIGRGPFAAMAFFLVTLFPALGFFNVYPMRYSFVADHFQYLATIGPIALAAAGVALALSKIREPRRGLVGAAVAVALLLPLALVTWQRSNAYRSMESLWRDTIARNPAAWMAHNNLGNVLMLEARWSEAIEHFERSLELNPRNVESWFNLAQCQAATGRPLDAAQSFRRFAREAPGSYGREKRMALESAARLAGDLPEATP